ncbi:MAG: DUF5675 family protein [Balneolales bacterium]
MKLLLVRYSSRTSDTLGLLFLDGLFHSYVLEDEDRKEKVPGKTRIPNGTYEISLRPYGGFHDRYESRFGSDFHRGMLQLKNVPGFTDILIHCGNDHEDTAGCLLVGEGCFSNRIQPGRLQDSTGAYKALYQQVAGELLDGDKIFIEVTDDISNYLKP